jgi:plasmid stability protein
MVALQIRDVPEDVREALAARAHARGQSLQAFLLALVKDEVRRAANIPVLNRFADRADGSRLAAGEATDALDAARAGRGATLTGVSASDIGVR